MENTNEQQRCAALNREGWVDFFANAQPVCPHCGAEIDTGRHDLWQIYEEGEHEVECPYCDLAFLVHTRISHTFSTDRQDHP